MAILHKLQTGLDVNVKFTGVRVFEYTPECIVFDLLDIPLYHGWLVDPQVINFFFSVIQTVQVILKFAGESCFRILALNNNNYGNSFFLIYSEKKNFIQRVVSTGCTCVLLW